MTAILKFLAIQNLLPAPNGILENGHLISLLLFFISIMIVSSIYYKMLLLLYFVGNFPILLGITVYLQLN